jgi:hypothetical protein
MSSESMPEDRRLDAVFAEYRRACGEVEPSPEFMPRLWERIESSRSFTYFLGRWTRGFVTAGAVLSFGLLFLSIIPDTHPQPLPTVTYVEALDEGHLDDNLDFLEPASLELSDPADIDEL